MIVLGVMPPHVRLETVRDIDHEQRQVRRIGHSPWGDVHEVSQPLVLFGIPVVIKGGTGYHRYMRIENDFVVDEEPR